MIFIASLALNGYNFQMPRVQFMISKACTSQVFLYFEAKQVFICCFFSL